MFPKHALHLARFISRQHNYTG